MGLRGTQWGWGVRNGAGGYATGQSHMTGQGQRVWQHATGCDGVVACNRVGGGGYGWGVCGALGYATGQWHAMGQSARYKAVVHNEAVVCTYGCTFMRASDVCACDHEGEAEGSTPRCAVLVLPHP